MVDDQPDGVLPVVGARGAEDGLGPRVPAVAVEAEGVQPEGVGPVGGPAGERSGQLAHVRLGVSAAVGPEGEQLHHLAGVVLVDGVALVLDPVEEDEHRRVGRDRARHIAERPEAVGAEDVGLGEHHLVGADAVVGGRPPVVEDQREALDQLVAGAQHAVEPVDVVAVPGVQSRTAARPRWSAEARSSGAGPVGRVSEITAASRSIAATRSTSPGRGPKPARHSRRSAWRWPNSPW